MTGAGGSNTQPALKVLVVEDDADIAALVATLLEREGFEVANAPTIRQARHRLADRPDVVVLDVSLPDGSGLDLLRELTIEDVPVVILSGRADKVDQIGGLELGAEDYVVKPFHPRELTVRIKRAARRGTPRRTRIDLGGLTIDIDTREAWIGDRTLELTAREFDLLAHLAVSPRRVFSRAELLHHVWRSSPDWQSPKTVTEHVRRLRHKIEDDPSQPRRIITVGNAGYRFEPGQPSPR